MTITDDDEDDRLSDHDIACTGLSKPTRARIKETNIQTLLMNVPSWTTETIESQPR